MTKKEELKRIKQRLVDNGDNEKISKLVSMSYLCFTIGNLMKEEAMELARKYGLVHPELSHFSGLLFRHFNLYNRCVSDMLTKEGLPLFIADVDKFEAVCRAYMDDKEIKIGGENG